MFNAKQIETFLQLPQPLLTVYLNTSGYGSITTSSPSRIFGLAKKGGKIGGVKSVFLRNAKILSSNWNELSNFSKSGLPMKKRSLFSPAQTLGRLYRFKSQ